MLLHKVCVFFCINSTKGSSREVFWTDLMLVYALGDRFASLTVIERSLFVLEEMSLPSKSETVQLSGCVCFLVDVRRVYLFFLLLLFIKRLSHHVR